MDENMFQELSKLFEKKFGELAEKTEAVQHRVEKMEESKDYESSDLEDSLSERLVHARKPFPFIVNEQAPNPKMFTGRSRSLDRLSLYRNFISHQETHMKYRMNAHILW